ncbi:MAG: endonuclease [Eubacteriales bacterium]|nr:endonuclease [Eubacteriales bacterium]
MGRLIKKILKAAGILLLVVIVAVVAFFGVLTVTEYKPKDVENLAVQGNAAETISPGDSVSVMTWNIGYGCLGETADFFMDGGTHVRTATKNEVRENMEAIISAAKDFSPDIMFYQEVDKKSKRSWKVNEEELFMEAFPDQAESFAYNFKTLYVPYPLPTIGRVESGLLTLSRFETKSADRIKLPSPFTYPVRLANLKRCLLVNRLELEGSDKELVLVNLHLEAYDSGEGKAAQTALLKEFLEGEAAKGNYVIAGGDFNQYFSNIDHSMYPVVGEELWQPGFLDVDEFGENLQFVQDNSSPSCRSLDKAYRDSDKENFQYYLIDGFLVSDNVKVDSVETKDLGFVNTDHNPVIMKVTLTE